MLATPPARSFIHHSGFIHGCGAGSIGVHATIKGAGQDAQWRARKHDSWREWHLGESARDKPDSMWIVSKSPCEWRPLMDIQSKLQCARKEAGFVPIPPAAIVCHNDFDLVDPVRQELATRH